MDAEYGEGGNEECNELHCEGLCDVLVVVEYLIMLVIRSDKCR